MAVEQAEWHVIWEEGCRRCGSPQTQGENAMDENLICIIDSGYNCRFAKI